MKFRPRKKFPLGQESLIWVEAEAGTFQSYRVRFHRKSTASTVSASVSTSLVSETTNLPLSKRSRLKFANDKTINKILPTVRLQTQQTCDDNLCFMHEENFSWCGRMASQSSPVIARMSRRPQVRAIPRCSRGKPKRNCHLTDRQMLIPALRVLE